MDRTDIAYLLNSTPKYFYLLPLHFTLLRRYAPNLKWPVYFASEENLSNHNKIKKLTETLTIQHLQLKEEDRFFLESRLAGCKALPSSIKYIFPIQEDFLLEHYADAAAIEEAIKILDENIEISSVRLMPCPGPKETEVFYGTSTRYKILSENETFLYTFQATLWRREDFEAFYTKCVEAANQFKLSDKYENESYDRKKKIIQVDCNIAETQGQRILKNFKKMHIAFNRAHNAPNAVYMSPWPYRPTAVEKGKQGDWVEPFANREGISLVDR
jgi:hypothetical protein